MEETEMTELKTDSGAKLLTLQESEISIFGRPFTLVEMTAAEEDRFIKSLMEIDIADFICLQGQNVDDKRRMQVDQAHRFIAWVLNRAPDSQLIDFVKRNVSGPLAMDIVFLQGRLNGLNECIEETLDRFEKEGSLDFLSEGNGRVDWSRICSLLGRESFKTGPEIWQTYSRRQIAGFLKITLDQKLEERKFMAALHGAEMRDGDGRVISDDGNSVDLRKITSSEEWQKARQAVMGR